MANYGIPYMGSKDSICDFLCKIFPKADHFYDLFGGGFSVTNAMFKRRSKDFSHFHFNEIKSDIVTLIKDAVAGKYFYDVFKPRWISRDDFFKNLNDPYVRICWSFGNNQTNYLFSKEIEPYKKSMHQAVVFNEFDDLAKKVIGSCGFKEDYSIPQKRLFLRNRIEFFRINGIPQFLYPYLNEMQINQLTDNLRRLQQLEQLERLEQLQQLERLEQLQQLQQLQQLEQLERINFYSTSYDKIDIKENSIIYCDPPYKDTGDYGQKFDTDMFLDWANDQKEPVFISEYDISDKRFRFIKSIKKRAMLYRERTTYKSNMEKIYINKAAQRRYL